MNCMINNADRLSSLPEEVQSHILSLMPTKFAVRTSILSRSWRYRWTSVTNLDFDDRHPFHDLHCFSKFVDRVLELYKSSQLKLFRLHSGEMWVQMSKLSKWIDAAVRLNVSEIDVKANLLELPLCMFTCSTLTKLRLDFETQNWYMDEVWECPSPINLPFLRTLEVKVFSNALINAFKLIPGCPMLESLTLQVDYRHHEEDYIFNIPTLKRLNLRCRKNGLIINKVVLHVPNLEYLFVGGELGSLFVMEDLSSLVEVSVSFDYIKSKRLWDEFLKGISGVKSLSFSGIPYLYPEESRSEPNRIQLILGSLESCSQLEHLCFEKKHITDDFWIEPKSVPACMLQKLTTMKYSNCTWKKCDMEFLEYMLRNAEVLKKVTISCLTEMCGCSQLLKLPKASRDCEIHFLGKGPHSTST